MQIEAGKIAVLIGEHINVIAAALRTGETG